MNQTPYQKIILARMGEITLKGLNRGKFEKTLLKNIRYHLQQLGAFRVSQSQSRIWIEAAQSASLPDDLEPILQQVAQVFGIVSVSPVWRFDGDMIQLEKMAVTYVRSLLADGCPRSFKVETRRGKKRFGLTSPEISAKIGGAILEAEPERLTVDVHNPDLVIYIEIRDQIFLFSQVIYGQKGLPVGTSGNGLLLLSGGIDSPVAGYMMASRGMTIRAVYFHAFPYTSDNAKEKVIELARLLTIYTGTIHLHIVDFTDIQVSLRDHCPAELLTVIIRRMMMRIADGIAAKHHCQALITGESLGQVASQTLEAINCTEPAAGRPVFRPLIGMDKDDTVQIARRIGTYETSILPYEDCCTIFVAKHPRTRPALAEIEAAEEGLDITALVAAGLRKIEEVIL